MKELKPNGSRARFAIYMLWIMFGLEIVSLISSSFQYSLLQDALNGEPVTDEMWSMNDLRESLVSLVYLMGYIGMLVAFIMWFRRAYYNLHQRTGGLNYTEGWAAGAWFVPIINLYRPCEIMYELYNKTWQVLASKEGADSPQKCPTSTIGWWWALWIINIVAGQFAFRISLTAETVDGLITSTFISIIGSLIGILLMVFSLKVVDDYSKIEKNLV